MNISNTGFRSHWITKVFSLVAVAVILCSLMVIPSSAAYEEYYGTWIFNDTVSKPSNSGFQVNFTSNGIEFSGFSFAIRNSATYVFYDTDDGSGYRPVVYVSSAVEDYTAGWQDPAFRTIQIINIDSDADTALFTWLNNYAVQVVSFMVNGVSYVAPSGATWSSFVSSTLNNGSFTIDGDSVLYNGYRINSVTPDDLIVEDMVYSFPPTASYFMTVDGVFDWGINSLNEAVQIFYIEGQGLTFVGLVSVLVLSIALSFLLINVVYNFFRNRG